MKKIVSILLAFSTCISMIISTNATVEDEYTYIVPESIRIEDIQRQVNEQIAMLEGSSARGSRDYTYYTEYVETKYETFSGFAGNQPSGGTRFETGGGFHWKDAGGPSVSLGVSFSVPAKVVDISVSLGISVGEGEELAYDVDVPNTTDYFKLHVSKTMEIKQANIYQQSISTGETSLYMTMYPSTLYRQSVGARKV